MGADHGLGTAFYYKDPDQNIVELNVNNYGNEWTATEHMRISPPTLARVDPDKMIAAQSGRFTLGIARAGHRWRIRSDKTLGLPLTLLNQLILSALRRDCRSEVHEIVI